jgi:hypothetical protein
MKHIPPPVKLMRGERFGRIVSFSRDAFKAQLANVTMRRPCSAVEIEATGRCDEINLVHTTWKSTC